MTTPAPESPAPSAPPGPPPTAQSAVAREWVLFTTGLQQLHATLHHELQDSWTGLALLIADQNAAAQAAETNRASLDPTEYADVRNAASLAVLLDILARWERIRPLQRGELAIEAFHRGVDDLLRRLPPSVDATGAEVVAVLEGGGALTRWKAGRPEQPRPIPFQDTIARAVQAQEEFQLDSVGRYLVAVAHGLQELRRGWDRCRQRIDAAMATSPADHVVAEVDDEQVVAGLEAEANASLASLEASITATADGAAHRLVRAAAWRRAPRPVRPSRRRTRQFEHWAIQLGSLESELRFERAQDLIERRLLALGERTVSGLEAERQTLLEGIDQFVSWLDQELALGDSSERKLPSVNWQVVPAVRRAGDLATAVRRILDALPDEVELVRDLAPAPRRRARRKAIAPDRMATAAFDRVGRSRLDGIFQEVQETHIRLLQQIERARQVVEFASEEEGEADDASVEHESLQNARSLLAVDRDATPTTLPAERQVVARTLADIFLQNRQLLSRSRLGALAHLGRLGVRQGLASMATTAVPAMAQGFRVVRRTSGRLWRSFLVTIQWMPASDTRREDVVRRAYLPQEFISDPRARQLPAIYRRLFRFEAVDDPRFLVGREREIRALTEARELWENDRPVATLVVGERGSGKTSLVNCALEGPLAGLPVIRGEFSTRLATADKVRAFLAELCGVPVEELEESLRSERRVLVLEETERSFLREMGGFGGIRELQRLIAATCGTTLWMLVLNQYAFRFLDASVQLGAGFSHRLNAASASPEAVREAILVRHHLSGLRLRFVPPVSERSRWAQIRRRLRGEADPETLFFGALARESAGVFRTAFELWLSQIDSVQAGTLVMRPMTVPELDEVIGQFDADNLFTLAAIAQHGSLTPEEHARVFRWDAEASRVELDGLLAREIIEAEPGRPGYRVRPVALRVTREALHRRNLG